jgi:ABC-2 type transport system permease protein
VSEIIIIARKEFKGLLSNRSTLITSLVVSLFFALVYGTTISGESSGNGLILVDGTVFFLATILGIFMAYSLTGHVFFREKTSHIIETLLSSPASLRQVWAGKVVGVSVIAYLLSLVAVIILTVVIGARNQAVVIPSAQVIFYVIVVIPFFIAAFVGLYGVAQFALGLRENRLIGFLIFIPLFAGLYGAEFSLGGITIITWLYVGLVLAGSLVLVLAATLLTRMLSKERIVTTID